MWTGYSLFRRRAFDDFAAMRTALEEELGDLGPVLDARQAEGQGRGGTVREPGPAPKPRPVPSTKHEDVDFDDF